MSVPWKSIALDTHLIIVRAQGCPVSSLPFRQLRDLVSHFSDSITNRNNQICILEQRSLASMGCAPSKPSRPRSREAVTTFRPYTGPKEFRGSVMPERRPHFQPEKHQVDQDQEQQRSHRRAAQMYQTYQKQDQQRGIRDGRRYSWEGHPSEKIFTTFEQMVERGVIPTKALKKK